MSNLSATTREIWNRTTAKQVYMKLILVRKLIERQQVLKAGTRVQHTVDYAEMDNLFQEYGPEDPLNGGKKTVVQPVYWYPKWAQVPVEVRGKDWRNNQQSIKANVCR